MGTVAERLEKIRTIHGLTYQEITDRLHDRGVDISLSTVHLYFTDDTNTPRVSLIEDLAEVMDCNPTYLAFGANISDVTVVRAAANHLDERVEQVAEKMIDRIKANID